MVRLLSSRGERPELARPQKGSPKWGPYRLSRMEQVALLSCAPIITSRALMGNKTSRSSWPRSPPVNWRKCPTYYVMDFHKGMAETVAKGMSCEKEIAACKWLTEEELAVHAAEFDRTGFQGALQRYRYTGGKYTAELEMFSGRTALFTTSITWSSSRRSMLTAH